MGCAASSQDAPPAIDPPPSAPPSAPRSSEQRATEQLPASFANEKPRASKSAKYSDEDLWRQSYGAEYGAAPASRVSAASMQTSAALDDGRDFKSGRQPTAWEKFARRASRKLSRKGVHAAVTEAIGGRPSNAAPVEGSSLGGGAQEREMARGDSFFGSFRRSRKASKRVAPDEAEMRVATLDAQTVQDDYAPDSPDLAPRKPKRQPAENRKSSVRFSQLEADESSAGPSKEST